MASRKSPGNPRRDDPKSQQRKGGGMLTGLLIGLLIGLVIAAGLAWYFNSHGPAFKAATELPPTRPKTDKPAPAASTPGNVTSPAEASTPTNPEPAPKPTPAPAKAQPPLADTAPSTAKPRVDYTFYGILPGDKPAKPSLPALAAPQGKDIWWLQVAALKNPTDADKLKARLTLLGLHVAMLKVESGGVSLYRVRVGPYKREDDALGDLDTLAANNFEPRLFKEPNPPAAPNTQEKP